MNNRCLRRQHFLAYLIPRNTCLPPRNISQITNSALDQGHRVVASSTILSGTSAIVALALLIAMLAMSSPTSLMAQQVNESIDHVSNMSAAVEVITDRPSTADAVSIRLSGMWRNACVPLYNRHFVTAANPATDSYIEIYAIAEPVDSICGQAETEWAFDLDVDLNLPGIYTVDLVILSGWDEEVQVEASTFMWVNGSITYQPEAPRSNDDVTIVIDGVHHDGCIPYYDSHSIINNKIIIEVDDPEENRVCGQAITPWQISIDMGSMTEGIYSIEAYITSYSTGEPIRELYQSNQLLIGSQRRQQQQFFYLPGIILHESTTDSTNWQ